MEQYVGTATTSIHKAVGLLQNTEIYSKLLEIYRRSSRNERIIFGGATLFTLYNLISYIKAKRQKLNLPPRVGYEFPILGHLPYMIYDSSRFLDWCREKYGDIFDINMMGSINTITTGRSAEETLKATSKDLSLEEGILKDTLFLHYVLDPTTFEVGFLANPPVAKDVISAQKIGNLTERIIRGLDRGLDILSDGKDEFCIKNPSEFFQRWVAYMSVSSLVGEEFEFNAPVIKSFADFTTDVIKNISIFMVVPKFLHRFIIPFLQQVEWHRQVMREHVLPIVRKRREKMRQAEQQGVPHGLDPNFLQGLIEFKKADGSQYTDAEVAQSVLLIAFASVHTTSMNLSFCLYWLLARPDLRERLEKEIQEVLGDGPITNEGLKQMTFLEQFIREVLRQSVDKLANAKCCVVDVYTFANGYQVPKGRCVQASGRQLNFGTNLARSTVEEMDPSLSGTKLASNPSRENVSFGLGRHLCPGRFFAIHEIKMSLITILRRYAISTESGKRPVPGKYLIGTVSINCEDPLLFSKKN